MYSVPATLVPIRQAQGARMVAFARRGSDTLALLPMHQPSVAKICCCSTNRPVHTEGRGGSADGRISERDSLFTKEAHLRLCPGANECRRLSIWQESTTVSTDLPGIDKRLHMEGKVNDICILLSISVFCLCCCVTYLHYMF